MAPEAKLFLSNCQITAIKNFRSDIHAVLDLERNKVGFPVLEFIQRGLFARGATNVGERIVVVDDRNLEGLTCELGVQGVVELEFGRITGTELVDCLDRPALTAAALS